MKKNLTLLVVCILTSYTINAQGLKFEDSSYFDRIALPKTRAILKPRVDLSHFTPVSYPQFGGTCVAHAFSKALTILECQKYGYTDASRVLQNSFSPYFIYYNLSPTNDYKCAGGLDIEEAAKFCLNVGQAKLLNVEYPNFYPFTTVCLGDDYPDRYPHNLTDDKAAAKFYKFGTLFRADNIASVKNALNQGMPVVGGFMIPESLQHCKNELFRWKGDGPKHGHAMVIVGYDDYKYGGAIKVSNSWGKDWGKDGFAWIPYNIAGAMLVRGYACTYATNTYQANNEELTNTLTKEYLEIKIDESTIETNKKELNFGFGDDLIKTTLKPNEYLKLAEDK